MTDGGRRCATCADEGVPMRVLRCDGERGLALCADPEGVRRTVETTLVGDVGPGALVLVHAGVALASLGPAA